MKVQVNQNIFKIAPSFRRGVLIVKKTNNHETNGKLNSLLKQTQQTFLEKFNCVDKLMENENIKDWDRVFRTLGVNPNSNPPSMKNLLKRILKGKAIKSINPIVDIFNILSIKYITPLGGDDIGNFVANSVFELGFAKGTENYTPLGKPDKNENPKPNEVVYYNVKSNEVLCRNWCVRNSDVTKITTQTKNVVINIDRLESITVETHLKIINELKNLVLENCGGKVSSYILSQSNSSSPAF